MLLLIFFRRCIEDLLKLLTKLGNSDDSRYSGYLIKLIDFSLLGDFIVLVFLLHLRQEGI